MLGQVTLHFHDKNDFTCRSYFLITTLVLVLNMKRYIFVCLCLVYLEPATIAIDSELINNGDEKISGSFNTQTESSIQEKNGKVPVGLQVEQHYVIVMKIVT